ncbi:MAG: lysophospholipid acyltransferase family protein [Chthoniobacterales bacterium]|nr:lysophospholipid acyltransferase family protein [Chthoniobacterales bacterium]
MPPRTAEPSTGQRVAAAAGALLLRALFSTLRLRVHDPEGFLAAPPPGPVIYAFWHNRILAITAAFRRVYPPGRRGVLVLTSASRDGMWLGELAARLGMGSVRGSSSRRGAVAMREMLEKVAQGFDIAITPDGPRGPKYHLGAGLVYLAQNAGLPVVTIHAEFGRCARLRSWDRFAIPLPFSRLDVTLGPILTVPQTADEAAFEAERRKIESVLRDRAD